MTAENERDPEVLKDSLDRRSFLKIAGALGLAATLGVAAEACGQIDVKKSSRVITSNPASAPGDIPEMPIRQSPVPAETINPVELPAPPPTLRPPKGTPLPLQTLAPAPQPTPLPVPTPAQSLQPTRTPIPTPVLAPRPVFTPVPAPAPVPVPLPPSTPTPGPAAIPSLNIERKHITHLLRRAGFGASRQEMEFFVKKGLSATIDYLLNYGQVDDSALDKRLASLNLDLTKIADLQRWWFLRMVYSQRPLLEKMVFFWHGILTSGNSRVGNAGHMLRQNQLFRQQAMSRYDILLKDISRDPAMLIWLDSRTNRKSAPNENFARELMELFSMGPGNYSERDVREAARAFTGYFLNAEGFLFNTSQHDYGSKAFLNTQDMHDGDSIIDVIMQQRAAAEFICTKLFTFFAYGNPEPPVLSRLTNVFWRDFYNIKSVLREIFTSDAFYSDKAYRARPKNPLEFVAGTIRSLGIETDGIGLAPLMTRMGQTLFDPPNVAGWPGGAAWFNSSTILERANFANRIATDRKSFKPIETIDKVILGSPKDVINHFAGLLLDGNVSPQQRSILDDYASGVMKVVEPDIALRALTYLVLCLPDYQLA